MKVLKSGIEVDPKDLSKLRGGACACGCDIGDDGLSLSQTGSSNGGCTCHCDLGNPEGVGDTGHSAELQMKPPVN